MSIRKKKAEAIIGGLMVDLAASGAFDALAIVRRACTQPNIRLAGDPPQSSFKDLLAAVNADVSNIADMFDGARVTSGAKSNIDNAMKHVIDLKRLLEKASYAAALARARGMSGDAFIEGEWMTSAFLPERMGGTEVDVQLIFKEEEPFSSRPQTDLYKAAIDRVVSNLDKIISLPSHHTGSAPASSTADRSSAIAEYRKVHADALAAVQKLASPVKEDRAAALKASREWQEWQALWVKLRSADDPSLSLETIHAASQSGRAALTAVFG